MKRAEPRGKPAVKGELFIVSAPSGAGKTTLCREVSRIVPRLKHSVSYTTRTPRKGEKNNVHYSFVNQDRFRAMLKKGEFAEWAVVHGNLYGTSAKRLKELSNKGYDIILDIDTQGALQFRRKFADAVYVFILPPNMKILEQRLKGRKSDMNREIKRRLLNARKEIASY
ncbi:MAG TPA: guanylate kinase, partial [Nitrospirae bacterium]|nr:guanylate kinase [Nitrospirota bacterium]